MQDNAMLAQITALEWPELCAKLDAGASVLTANKRLARVLLERYAQYQQSLARRVWPRAEILPWSAWCRRELDAVLDEPAPWVLSERQSEHVWRQVIAATEVPAQLQVIAAQCARPAAEAWALLQAHRIEPRVLQDQPDIEAQLLACWIESYQNKLTELGALDRNQLGHWLVQAIAAGRRTAPAHIVLAGFHELSPDLHDLLQALVQNGTTLERLQWPQQQAAVQILAAGDAEEEVRTAARWARARLQHNPASQIAIIVLDLSERRALLERVFSDVLSPQIALGAYSGGAQAFNISLGSALADEPIVHDAVLALRWVLEPLEFAAVSCLLRSPFLHFNGVAQASLEQRLRQLNLYQPSMDQVLYQAGGEAQTPWRSATFATRWRAFRSALYGNATNDSATVLSPLQWADTIATALADLGWARGRTLSSREYQAVNAFHDCLEQLATLHAVLPRCGLAQVLGELQQLAQQQIFQVQQDPAPILITEPLQTLGMHFDQLWLMGASDEVWPEAPRPNPLIPHKLQREHEMAHATAAGELHYASTLMQLMLASADEVVVSWPRVSGDKNLRPSPLLAKPWLTKAVNTATTADWLRTQAIAAAPMVEPAPLAATGLQHYVDEQAPVITAAQARGGAGILNEQSACPFRALAFHRWQLSPITTPGVGLNAAQRGTLLHRALQAVYELSEGELPTRERWQALATQSAHIAITAQRAKFPALMDARINASEHQRLSLAVIEWLQIDADRPEPFTVVVLEAAREFELGPLKLSLRVDRLDRLADGRYVLIDYKGGQSHRANEWFGVRPKAPQLPLYALALEASETLAALLFGNLKPGARGYTGLALEDDLIAGVKTVAQAKDIPVQVWQELIPYWRLQLSALAEDFARGQAAVAPRDAAVCRYCALPPLCRIHSQAQALSADVDMVERVDD